MTSLGCYAIWIFLAKGLFGLDIDVAFPEASADQMQNSKRAYTAAGEGTVSFPAAYLAVIKAFKRSTICPHLSRLVNYIVRHSNSGKY